MYAVLVMSHNRVNHIKAFDVWDLAITHANELVMDLKGTSCSFPKWEDGPYRNVFEHGGVAIMIESVNY